MRSSRHVLLLTTVVIAAVTAIPTAGRSNSSKDRKPVGKLKIVSHNVFVGGTVAYNDRQLYAGGGVRTGPEGEANISLDLKRAQCTIRRRTRIILRPAPSVVLRVTSVSADVWCSWGRGEGEATLEGPNKKGHKTTVTTKDPVFGFVVTKQKVIVKVTRGAVVVAGRSGLARAVVVGRARQVVVGADGQPRQPAPIALTAAQRRVAARLSAFLPAAHDLAPPRVEFLNVPGQATDEILARLSFRTIGKESRADVTYSCSFDRGGFFVCSPPVLKAFGPGRHEFAVRAVDAAGNVGNPVRAKWTVVRPREGWITFQSKRDNNWELYAMNADGSGEARLTNNTAVDVDPAWSPNGDQLLFESDRLTGRASDIWVMDIEGSNVRPLIRDASNERNPKWSPVGNQIAFESNRDGDYEIYVADVRGNQPRQLTFNGVQDSEPAWSPDGTKIVFESVRDGNRELYVLNVNGSGEPRRLMATPASEHNPAWSPDGKRIAFNSDRGGNNDVYVISADGGPATRLTTDSAADTDPAWSPLGTQIAFSSHRGRTTEIWVMDADGSNQKQLTRSAADSLVPDW
jgi:Tol biopolymer transport system component